MTGHGPVAGLLSLVLVLFGSVASANCQRLQFVDAVGYGTPGQITDSGVSQALANALAEAVVQVNGSFLQQQTEIETVVINTITGDAFESDVRDGFREEIRQSAAGVVESYEILERDEEHGLIMLTVRAGICADPRILLDFGGERSVQTELAAGIGNALNTAGWRVADSGVSGPVNVADRLSLFFVTGATHVFRVDSNLVRSELYRGMNIVDLEVNGTLTDLRQSQQVSALAVQAEGLGNSQQSAMHDAAATLGRTLGQQLLNSLGAGQGTRLRVTVSGVTRQSTQYELQDSLQGMTDVQLDGQVAWDAELQKLTAFITSTPDSCTIASQLADSRRLLLRVESCSSTGMQLHAVRE